MSMTPSIVATLAASQSGQAWDQAEAVRRVERVIELERSGKRPWKSIEWETDPAAAQARAARDQKPILVYFFLEKDSGPQDAPC